MRQLAKLGDPRVWLDKGLEAIERHLPPHAIDAPALTYAPDKDALAEVEIHWPAVYNWVNRHIIGNQILTAFRQFVPVTVVDIPQPHEGVINFVLVVRGKRYKINLEVCDVPKLNEEASRACDLHFKLQYQLGGYGLEHVLPGGYLNNDPVIYGYLPWLRRIRDQRGPRYDVSGRFQLRMDKRREPINRLKRSTAFGFHGGEGKVRYNRYLKEVAYSKVCIDLPGSANVTFRIFDYFAIGACVVGPPHFCQPSVPFIDGEHLVYCKDDYSDFEDVCVALLNDEAERRRLVQNSREFFDKYMHRDQMASYYLYHCLRILP